MKKLFWLFIPLLILCGSVNANVGRVDGYTGAVTTTFSAGVLVSPVLNVPGVLSTHEITVTTAAVSGILSSVTINTSGIVNTEALAVTTAAVSGTLNVAEVTVGTATHNVYLYQVFDEDYTAAQIQTYIDAVAAAVDYATIQFVNVHLKLESQITKNEGITFKGVGFSQFQWTGDTRGIYMMPAGGLDNLYFLGPGNGGTSTQEAVVFDCKELFYGPVFGKNHTYITNCWFREWHKGVYFEANDNTEYASFIKGDLLSFDDVDLPIDMLVDETKTNCFINGNQFSNLHINDYNDTAITLMGADGNTFLNIQAQNGTDSTYGIKCSGFGNYFQGFIWDLVHGDGERLVWWMPGANNNTLEAMGEIDPRLVWDQGQQNFTNISQLGAYSSPARPGRTRSCSNFAFDGDADNFIAYGLKTGVVSSINVSPAIDYNLEGNFGSLLDPSIESYTNWSTAGTVNIGVTLSATADNVNVIGVCFTGGNIPATINLWIDEGSGENLEGAIGGLLTTDASARTIEFDILNYPDVDSFRFEMIGGASNKDIAYIWAFSSTEKGRRYLDSQDGIYAGGIKLKNPSTLATPVGYDFDEVTVTGDVWPDDLLYYDKANDWYAPADADVNTNNVQLAMMVDAAGAGANRLVMFVGKYRDSSWNFGLTSSDSSIVYMSRSAKGITQTKPTTSGAAAVPVGIVLGANLIKFDPSKAIWYVNP